MNPILSAIVAVSLLGMTGCKNPFNRSQNAEGGATGVVSGSAKLTVFNNELSTGGGAFLYPGGENHSIIFDHQTNTIGRRSLRYMWNGKITNPDGSGYEFGATYGFAGFSLMHTAQQSAYTSTAGRDLRAAGYTRVTFYARGSLATYTTLKVEAGGPTAACMTLSTSGTADECSNGNTGRLSEDWQAFRLTVSSTQQSAIKDFFKATFVFTDPTPGSTNPGQGGVVYFDQIFYEP